MFKIIEKIAREQKLMEKYNNVDIIPINEPYFTTSQECDINDLIDDDLFIDEIIEIIKQW